MKTYSFPKTEIRAIAVILFLFLPVLPGQSFLYGQNASRDAAPAELLSESLTQIGPVNSGSKIIVAGFYFEDGSAQIGNSLKRYLRSAAAQIKKARYKKIFVDGYTDDRGNNALNNRLSRARADSVKKELAKNGIPASKITARGYGSIKPIADNNTKNGRIRNRRVEILVL
jgi:outer membrane protein OmpA-like peptidoglycan-associated protein